MKLDTHSIIDNNEYLNQTLLEGWIESVFVSKVFQFFDGRTLKLKAQNKSIRILLFLNEKNV